MDLKCYKCGHTKPSSEFASMAGGTGSRPCRTCQVPLAKVSNDLRNPRSNAISRVMGQRMGEEGIRTSDHYLDEHTDLRHRLRKEIMADGSWQRMVEPNKQAATPPEPKPRTRKDITPSRWLEPTMPKTGRWSESASPIIRNNLLLLHKVCEYTGAHERFCQESHLLARHICRAWGYPEWADDEENAVFIQSGFNSAMVVGCWIDTDGHFRLPNGEAYDEWYMTLALPTKRIQMYGKRPWFALMAALGAPVPMFTNGPMVP